jgi:membrane protein DedA with SNARE-associated domain
MHEIVHHAFVWMMELVRDWGYAGVAFLMALESSIVPIPSEVVIPPAAFWSTQGLMNIYLVVLAGTAGCWLGSAVSYWVSYAVGRPLVFRFGKYFGFSPEKLLMAENWVRTYGTEGIFFARLLPVIRHLISIPAGICRMPFASFSAATVAGAGIWCATLAWFGTKILTAPMLEDATKMVAEVKHRMHFIVLLVLLVAVLYALKSYFANKGKLQPDQSQIEEAEELC